MKNQKIRALFGLFLGLSLLVSCQKTPTSTSSSASVSAGDEPWIGNYDGVSDDENSVAPLAHQCENKCPLCGKCIDDSCQDPVCKDKCSDLNGRTLYTFNAIDERVKLTNGSGSLNIVTDDQGGHIGNFSNNLDCSILFEVNSPAANRACLQATISQMVDEKNVTSDCSVLFNGTEIIRPCVAPAGTDNWVNFITTTIGCIDLIAGVNTIEFKNPVRTGSQFDFRGIRLISSEKLSLKDANGILDDHECTSKDSNGKCTDYDCNKWNCLDKEEEGWTDYKINGDDDKVIKVNSEGQNLWNPAATEQCIGQISGYTGQTLVWSFECSEDTYIRFSLEHSLNFPRQRFADTWNMVMNGKAFTTDGRTVIKSGGWADYDYSKIGYVHAVKGKNSFRMVHKITSGYNIRHFEAVVQKGTLTFVQAAL